MFDIGKIVNMYTLTTNFIIIRMMCSGYAPQILDLENEFLIPN